MLTWGKPNERYYQHGLDRGVLYIPGRDPIAWNGLTGFDEGSEQGSTTVLYRDGVVYLADSDASDFRGKMSALFFPDAFGACIGFPKVTDGFFVDSQKPKRFGMSYRSLIGSGSAGDMFGYQIHLVYNCMASVSTRSRRTLGEDSAPVVFDFDLVCTPVKLPGYRPSAHYVIDTRGMSASKLAEIETIIYGDDETPGELPDPEVLFDLLNYGDAIVVTVHPDETFTVVASNDNLEALDESHFIMRNINGVDIGDGLYTISDGGTTDVIIE
jgi:hypothetical protein